MESSARPAAAVHNTSAADTTAVAANLLIAAFYHYRALGEASPVLSFAQ
jgi:hypothetical protein